MPPCSCGRSTLAAETSGGVEAEEPLSAEAASPEERAEETEEAGEEGEQEGDEQEVVDGGEREEDEGLASDRLQGEVSCPRGQPLAADPQSEGARRGGRQVVGGVQQQQV